MQIKKELITIVIAWHHNMVKQGKHGENFSYRAKPVRGTRTPVTFEKIFEL